MCATDCIGVAFIDETDFMHGIDYLCGQTVCAN